MIENNEKYTFTEGHPRGGGRVEGSRATALGNPKVHLPAKMEQ